MPQLLRRTIIRFARFAIDGSSQPILEKHFGRSGAPILNDIWANVTAQWSEVAKQTTIGRDNRSTRFDYNCRLSHAASACCITLRSYPNCLRHCPGHTSRGSYLASLVDAIESVSQNT